MSKMQFLVRRAPTFRYVIPAKAGIHFAASQWRHDGSRLSPG